MSDRLKIMACGAVERIEDNILDEMQVQVFDTITKKSYNVDCNLVGEPENGDSYEISVYSVEKDNLLILVEWIQQVVYLWVKILVMMKLMMT